MRTRKTRTPESSPAGRDHLVEELLEALPKAELSDRLATNRAEVLKIAQRDYGAALRNCLSGPEVREILKEGQKRVWPNLNQLPVNLRQPEDFARGWSRLGVEIRFSPMPKQKGLLGFYAKETAHSPQPLIWVNTAHHAAVVGVSLDHEMGHHLTSEMFDAKPDFAQLSQFGFEQHLVDQGELAADLLVSTGIYPLRTANLLLQRDSPRRSIRAKKEIGCATVFEYIARQYNLTLDPALGAADTLQVLAGLLHYTKLRQAMMEEYDT